MRLTGSRRRSPVSKNHSRGTSSSSSPSARKGAHGTAGREPGSSSSGDLSSIEPVCTPARTASRPRISSWQCSCAPSRASRMRLVSRAHPIAPRSGRGSSTCATHCSARPSTTCERSRPSGTGRRSRQGYALPMPPKITVVGSVNLDLVARCEVLPRPGETVSGATLERFPGGKGANQAVACARLGAQVRMVAAVGRDAFAEEALAGLREAGVELDLQVVDDPTGIALITVDANGETTIVVSPGANAQLGALRASALRRRALPAGDPRRRRPRRVGAVHRHVLSQCRTGSPDRRRSRPRDRQPLRARFARPHGRPRGVDPGRGGCGTAGGRGGDSARGARRGSSVVDGTAAGDAFAACLVVSLLEGRDHDESLARSCAAGALAASRAGAQPSLPTAAEIDAILRR